MGSVHYDIDAGVSVSAGFRIQVCFIAGVTIDVSVSLSATVHILGPPLHGEATLDLDVCSVTLQFGDPPATPPSFLSWPDFRDKYIVAGAADGSVVSAHAGGGLLAPESPSRGRDRATRAVRPPTRGGSWATSR